MNSQNWHVEFNPQKFLSRVSWEKLVERNVAFNESVISDAKSPCILCKKSYSTGILLNNKSFLCKHCYTEVETISYPEKYETLRRNYLVANEARKIAWQTFKERFEYNSQVNNFVYFGWASILLAFVNPMFLILSAVLLTIGYEKNESNKRKLIEWDNLKSRWEQSYPEGKEPELKHFHDPSAFLSERDQLILKVFNHWPGYPPFWKYLRSIVLTKDSNRCQVTGCPSRLQLHVHHMRAVSDGGTHTPDNLVTLCDFHHALEPEKGHERIWGNIKTQHFTLVCAHERGNRGSDGIHAVRAHLRRLQLITQDELHALTKTYGFYCPDCREPDLKITLLSDKNIIKAECPACGKSSDGAQQLTEESGPRLAEILGIGRNQGRWTARWDMLVERKGAVWGTWSGHVVSAKRKQHKEQLEIKKSAPLCPKCGSAMQLKIPRKTDSWKAFWGCTHYSTTGCKGSARYSSKNR